MKTFACKDMGMDDGFVAEGMTNEEVMGKIKEHAREMHSDMMAKMSDSEKEEMMGKMESMIHDKM